MTALGHEIRRLSSDALGSPPWDPPAPLPRSALPAHGDVVVIGAGLTGLSAALALASRHVDVVVVEYAFGSGATPRSGGIVIGETLVGPAPGFDRCEDELRDWIQTSEVSCGLAWNGCLELARNESLSPKPIDWTDAGVVRFSTPVNGGVLDPARLLEGLALAALRAGVRIVDTATVDSIESSAGQLRLATSRGSLSARRVVMAADATSDNAAIDPWDERGITVAVQTIPLSADLLTPIGLGADQAFYTVDLPLLWGRVMPDGSLLIGRELIQAPVGPTDRLGAIISAAGERLLARARGLHRALNTIALKRAWGGPIVRTSSGIPIVAPDPQLPGLVWAGGYGGQGIAQAFRVGRLVAEHLRR